MPTRPLNHNAHIAIEMHYMHPQSHYITAYDIEPVIHFQQTQGRSLHCTTQPLQLGQTVALEETLIQSEQSHIRAQSGAVEVEVALATG